MIYRLLSDIDFCRVQRCSWYGLIVLYRLVKRCRFFRRSRMLECYRLLVALMIGVISVVGVMLAVWVVLVVWVMSAVRTKSFIGTKSVLYVMSVVWLMFIVWLISVNDSVKIGILSVEIVSIKSADKWKIPDTLPKVGDLWYTRYYTTPKKLSKNLFFLSVWSFINQPT